MPLSEIDYGQAQPIDSYGPGFFRIAGQVLHGAVLVTATGARLWQGYGDPAPLFALAGRIDVLFVGTGREIAHLPPALRRELEAAGLGVEIMDSPAACRTYNVLLSEGRRIAAALLPVD
ncbi:Mth938-like domain-containing protein [Defluviimonas sp. WL0075]|uniref:Mth938-like domain-containing protein n=1 Tax=Albidovulum sediminicola TaxID=2984331 RepID=A0ABT2Z2M3_9RHOB|nr:Mth938-like domain-containing protein [Defluviimonas sp. WL0075]MCV2865361.1 Mth938-like domain-containing protein [Defluviimonas sp. WL0075]